MLNSISPSLSVDTFIFLSRTLESIGDSAYIGAAYLIKSPSYLTSAAVSPSHLPRHVAELISLPLGITRASFL